MEWHLLAPPLWGKQASSQRSGDMPPFILINFKKGKIHFHVVLRKEFFLLIILYKPIRRKPEIKMPITDGLVSSAHDLAEGGLAIALAESAFANGLGVDVKVDITNAQLFSETRGRFILSISPENQATFEKLLTESSVSGEVIGKVTDSGILEMNELSISTDEAVSIYEGALPALMK